MLGGVFVDWPEGVLALLAALDRAGHQAWAVGGCVRDLTLGRRPHDWDVCTSATPDQMKSALAKFRLIETGLRHGTLTALTPQPIEVTTYRVDGPYVGHRRPAEVRFVDRLEEDLARRDFTINAMALRPDKPLVDLFGGKADLQARLVRCVGQARLRFEEDALRMLRCLRFASQLDFSIEDQTAQALIRGWPALAFVSAERIGAEYQKLMCGPGAGRVVAQFRDQLHALTPLRQVDLAALSALPPAFPVRMGFALESADHLPRLRLDKRTNGQIRLLCRLREQPLPQTRCQMLRLLGEAGPQAAGDLLAIWAAQGQDTASAARLLQALIRQGAPCRLADLAVTGADLIPLGLTGPQVGKALNHLLDQVMAGRLPNRREELLFEARKQTP